jgi:hypothetical protein
MNNRDALSGLLFRAGTTDSFGSAEQIGAAAPAFLPDSGRPGQAFPASVVRRFSLVRKPLAE